MLWTLFAVAILENGKIDYKNIEQIEVFQTRFECELVNEKLTFTRSWPDNTRLVCLKTDEAQAKILKGTT